MYWLIYYTKLLFFWELQHNWTVCISQGCSYLLFLLTHCHVKIKCFASYQSLGLALYILVEPLNWSSHLPHDSKDEAVIFIGCVEVHINLIVWFAWQSNGWLGYDWQDSYMCFTISPPSLLFCERLPGAAATADVTSLMVQWWEVERALVSCSLNQ